MLRLTQYIKRIANVVLFALPGQYRKRKLQILEEMFQKGLLVLNETGEAYWLDFGTLLGYHRTGSIIPHDVDIDIAMMESSYEKVKALKDKLPKGLSFHDTSANHEGPKIYFSYKGYDFDIFFYEDEGETIRTFVEADYPNERQHIPKELVYPLKEDIFLGETVTVPSNTLAYLELMYGYLGTGGWRDQKTGLWHPPST
ncbi:LicD family protein [Ekhidna lutea]|uniref:LicD family protein n=1 Tax=Ekhidna lutea TaxID=447679 RepID=A0A239FRM6_EKHLU|nr:LicD family protein [Ekhidna lutea]SNS59706.1 LicD family protein [Ekhidna lutea]